MSAPLYTIDIAARPVGQHYGGKHAVSVACPVCGKPALIHKKGFAGGAAWTDYAHRISIDLDHKNEAQAIASQVCRAAGDPSRKRKRGRK